MRAFSPAERRHFRKRKPPARDARTRISSTEKESRARGLNLIHSFRAPIPSRTPTDEIGGVRAAVRTTACALELFHWFGRAVIDERNVGDGIGITDGEHANAGGSNVQIPAPGIARPPARTHRAEQVRRSGRCQGGVNARIRLRRQMYERAAVRKMDEAAGRRKAARIQNTSRVFVRVFFALIARDKTSERDQKHRFQSGDA